VTVHDGGESKGQFYLVMEFVEGKPLGALFGKADRKSLLELIEKAARGVGAAHAKGVVHRDLKPDNILVAPDGQPKVADFGLAHVADSTLELTRAGTALGTPLYMSPEQVSGSLELTPRTDVFALGAVLYEALTGTPPFQGQTVQEIYARILNSRIIVGFAMTQTKSIIGAVEGEVKAGVPLDIETVLDPTQIEVRVSDRTVFKTLHGFEGLAFVNPKVCGLSSKANRRYHVKFERLEAVGSTK
jgi:serine/threonine protein kinase